MSPIKKITLKVIVIFIMAEKEGFEPSRAFTPIGFRDRPLQPLGYFSNNVYYTKF